MIGGGGVVFGVWTFHQIMAFRFVKVFVTPGYCSNWSHLHSLLKRSNRRFARKLFSSVKLLSALPDGKYTVSTSAV